MSSMADRTGTVFLQNLSVASLYVLFVLMHERHVPVRGQSVVFYQRNAAQCGGRVLSGHLRYDNMTVESKVHCAAMCGPDEVCQSFLFDPYTMRCARGSQATREDCSNTVPAKGLQHYDVKSVCKNGGSLGHDGMCICPKGYMGDCSTPMRDCHHGHHEGGYAESGVYWVLPPLASDPFSVFCQMKGSQPRTFVMNRFDSGDLLDFNRAWVDYKTGFGDLQGDFWIGLEKLYMLTNGGNYSLIFRVKRSNPAENLYQQYDHFRVASGDDLYRVTFDPSSTTGDLGDSFSPSSGAYFSTPDKDNDENSDVNCAARHKAGWWFRGERCSLCNPTGPLLHPKNGKRVGIPDEAFWTVNLGNAAPYKLSAYLVNMD